MLKKMYGKLENSSKIFISLQSNFRGALILQAEIKPI